MFCQQEREKKELSELSHVVIFFFQLLTRFRHRVEKETFCRTHYSPGVFCYKRKHEEFP